MPIKVDFHVHTNKSKDAKFSIDEILDRAEKEDVTTIAITDHDSIESWYNKFRGSKNTFNKIKYREKVINVINGIEITCSFNNQEVHILGYFLNSENLEKSKYFNAFLGHIETYPRKAFNRIKKVCEKLKEDGFEIDVNELEGKFDKYNLGIRLLKKYRKEIFERFKDFLKIENPEQLNFSILYNNLLKQGRKYHVPIEILPSAEEVVKWIKDFKGFVSLAHPQRYENLSLKEILDKLIKIDPLIAVEGNRLKEAFNGLKTYGTDFHDDARKLGIYIGDEDFDKILKTWNFLI